MDRRPPLAVSPRRLRPRLRPVLRPLQTDQSSPPGAKSKPNPQFVSKSLIPRPDYRRSTSDLIDAKKANQDLQNIEDQAIAKPRFLKPPAAVKSAIPRPEYRRSTSDLGYLTKKANEELRNTDVDDVEDEDMAKAPVLPVFERGRLYELYAARRNERLMRKRAEVAPETMAYEPGVAVELAKRRKAMVGVRKSLPPGFSMRSSTSSIKEMKKPTLSGKSVADIGRRSATRSTIAEDLDVLQRRFSMGSIEEIKKPYSLEVSGGSMADIEKRIHTLSTTGEDFDAGKRRIKDTKKPIFVGDLKSKW